jgi:NTE family protein
MPDVYGVFEGGGVRGTALVGAVAAAEAEKYTFRGLAGTSAGAIVASLLAAGYTASEMRILLMEKDFREFKDPVAIPGLREIYSLWKLGRYKGDAFRRWIEAQLKHKLGKPAPRFTDLPKPLTVIAADVAHYETKIYNRKRTPDDRVADAVRASMSIPFFYVPVRANSSIYVDGGVLSNFPAWALEDEMEEPSLPILGFRLQKDDEEPAIGNMLGLAKALAATIVNAAVEIQVELADLKGLNVIDLPTLGISTTDFNIDNKTKERLYKAGLNAALAWLKTNTLSTPDAQEAVPARRSLRRL